jgi:hypothetical protein
MSDISQHILEEIRDQLVKLREDVRELKVRTAMLSELELRVRDLEKEAARAKIIFSIVAAAISLAVNYFMGKL